MKIPVLLMTYRRSESTQIILNILKNFKIKNLYVFNDGLKIIDHKETHKATRNIILKNKKHFNMKMIFPKKNLTQKFNLPFALNIVFKKYDKIIILEDDCIPNRSFFKFCQELLYKYEKDNRICQISGNNFLNFKNYKRRNNDSYFFSKFTSSWGWATWKDRWVNYYDTELKLWPQIKKERWLDDILKNDIAKKFWLKNFTRRYSMIDDDWDRPWTLTNFINSRLTIFPSKNLISNKGDDDYAIHKNPSKWDSLKLEDMKFPLKHPNIITQDSQVDNFLTKEGFSTPKLSYRIKNKIKKFFF